MLSSGIFATFVLGTELLFHGVRAGPGAPATARVGRTIPAIVNSARFQKEYVLSAPLAHVQPGSGGESRSADTETTQEISKLIDARKLKEAEAELKLEISRHGETYQSTYLEARILFEEEDYRQSMALLRRCLAANPRDATVYKLVALNAIRMNRLDIARPALESAVDLAPQDYTVRFNLGALDYTENRFRQAEQELETALQLNPNSMPARLFLGLTLEEIGTPDAVLAAYRRAIKLDQEQGLKVEQPYLYLGRYLYRQAQFRASLPPLEKAVSISPHSSEGLCWLGKALFALGRKAEASDSLNRSIAADAHYAEPHYVLSRIYMTDGRDSEAQEEFRLFQELKKSEKRKEDGRRRLRNVN